MINLDTSEGKWFSRLSRELHDRRTGRSGARKWNRGNLATSRIRPPLDVLADYRAGDPPLRADIHSGWKPYVRQFVRMGRLNQADLIISATASRLQLRDFRTSAAEDEFGDLIARNIMRANDLKVKAREVHDMALTMGYAYAIATPPSDGRKHALITEEDPREVITAHDAATGEYLAALKLFRDEWDSEDVAYLYLPGKIRRARRSKGSSIFTNGPHRFDKQGWAWDDGYDVTVPGNQIPVTRFRNRDGVGEYEYHLDTLDRINDKIFDEWWIAKTQAFRQRAVKNLPEEDEAGEEIDYADMFTASPDEMWQVPGDVDFWESTAVDLTPITASIEKDRQRLASVLSVPMHTVTPDAANGSAEGASTMKEEHIFKCEDRRDRFDGSWARVMSQALLFENEVERSAIEQIEPQWAPIERYSLAQKAEAASKAGTSLPAEIIQRDIWQYAPAEIPELRRLRGADLLYGRTPTGGRPAAE